jgi:hypothetical protein
MCGISLTDAKQYEDGLEVAPHQTNQPGLEVHEHYNDPINKAPVLPNGMQSSAHAEKNGIMGAQGYSELPPKSEAPYHANAYSNNNHYNAPPNGNSAAAFATTSSKRNTVCGLRRRTFWCIVAAIAIVIIGAVVGGVIGGLRANKGDDAAAATSSREAASSAAVAASSSAAPSGSSSSATPTQKQITTTTLLTMASATYLSDCPSANGTLFKVVNGGKTLNYRVMCGAAIFNNEDPKAAINNNQNSLNDCIKQCAINVPNGQTCNAVCWRNSRNHRDTAAIGSCFGYNTVNTTQNTFRGTLQDSYCDGAVFVGTGDDWADAF